MNIYFLIKMFNNSFAKTHDNGEHNSNNEIEDKHEQKNNVLKDNNLQNISNKDSPKMINPIKIIHHHLIHYKILIF